MGAVVREKYGLAVEGIKAVSGRHILCEDSSTLRSLLAMRKPYTDPINFLQVCTRADLFGYFRVAGRDTFFLLRSGEWCQGSQARRRVGECGAMACAGGGAAARAREPRRRGRQRLPSAHREWHRLGHAQHGLRQRCLHVSAARWAQVGSSV